MDLHHASHTVTEVKEHLVWSMKYRKNLLHKKEYKESLRTIIFEISERYWYTIIELATDGDHIHILLQHSPDDSIASVVKTIKSISAKEMFRIYPELKKYMWGAALWESGYFARSVGDETTTQMITKYIQGQGRQRGVKAVQIRLF
jgi:putative transposase